METKDTDILRGKYTGFDRSCNNGSLFSGPKRPGLRYRSYHRIARSAATCSTVRPPLLPYTALSFSFSSPCGESKKQQKNLYKMVGCFSKTLYHTIRFGKYLLLKIGRRDKAKHRIMSILSKKSGLTLQHTETLLLISKSEIPNPSRKKLCDLRGKGEAFFDSHINAKNRRDRMSNYSIVSFSPLKRCSLLTVVNSLSLLSVLRTLRTAFC